ncbi:MAG: aspartyl protease family protein [Candidatus Acidiferrales bacterium]
MQFLKRASAFLIVAVAGISAMHATAHTKSKAKTTPADLAPADSLFQAGRFAEAQKIYAQVAERDPKSFSAALQLGYIALLSNKLDDAEAWLRKALDLKHSDVDAKVMLAETFYRRNDFFHAGKEISGLGPQDAGKLKNYSTLNAAKLESFRDDDPYKFEKGAGESTRLPFVKSDPLPLVRVRVNGGAEAIFFIDTGSSELLLDTEFARELKVKPMGAVQGSFSGGQNAEVQNGRVDSVTLGSWTIKNVPVGMLPLRSLSGSLGVQQIDGCIGTNVLYQFLSTIDFRAGELILRKKTANNVKRFEAADDGKGYVVPMWMAGDHFILTWGQVDTLPPSLFFVDSGLAGAGIKLADSTIKQSGIKLNEALAGEGRGGGGQVKVIPYTAALFSVGAMRQQNVAGLYDGPFPWEDDFGFHLAGMYGGDFLNPYSVTFDFSGMRIIFR